MTLKCSKACKDGFIFSVFKGCRRFLALALLRAFNMGKKGRERRHFHQNCSDSELHLWGNSGNRKQRHVKTCSRDAVSCFPLHYLSCVEEHTLKQLRGYLRFIKWDKIEHEGWIPTRNLLLQEYICCLGIVFGRLSDINDLINYPSKVKSEQNLQACLEDYFKMLLIDRFYLVFIN